MGHKILLRLWECGNCQDNVFGEMDPLEVHGHCLSLTVDSGSLWESLPLPSPIEGEGRRFRLDFLEEIRPEDAKVLVVGVRIE
jgi:hypothetical protein